jgi:potassium-dependent mechanosensitive channel
MLHLRHAWKRRLTAMLMGLAGLGMATACFAQGSPAPTPPQQQQSPEPAALPAEVAIPPETSDAVAHLGETVERLEKAVERVRLREEGLAAQRAEADGLLLEAQKIADSLRPRSDEIRIQIEKLGKPPEKGAAPESQAIASERARLSGLASQVDGALKAIELSQLRARQQIARIQDYRHKVFAQDLMRRTQSPLLLTIWRQVAEELPRIGHQVRSVAERWWAGARHKLPELTILFLVCLAAYVGLTIAQRRLFARALDPVPDPLPNFFTRAGRATLVAALRALPVVASVSLLYLGLDNLGTLDYQVQPIAEVITQAVIIAAAVSGLSVAVFTPRYAHWRLFDLSDHAASRLSSLTRWIAAVFAFDMVLRELIRLFVSPLPVSIVQTFFTSVAFAGLLIGIVRTPFTPGGLVSGEPLSRYQPKWLKFPLLALALAILVASLLGYVALGSFIASQVLLTGSCAVAIVLLHAAISAIANEPEDAGRPVGRMLESGLGLDLKHRQQVSQVLTWLLNAALVAIAVPAILLSLGFSTNDIFNAFRSAVFGFEIGQFRISLARILMAIALFAGILTVTRLVQRWLTATVLSPARMDPAIAHSIYTGIGYAGAAIAGLVGVSYVGLDITNLAIVAGALSVGIGFGLQSIVNNFVSGLILLIERPIKVGDWIVVKGQEGYVRRISVRATEIETFDRASLILPNSELITGPVTNWTHRNAMGRVIIRVGATYKADPQHVMDVLTEVGRGNAFILQQPAPRVVLDNLGVDGFEFSIRVFVADINKSIDAQNSLRVEIHKAFLEAGIAINTVHQDLLLREAEARRISPGPQPMDARRR